MHNHIIQMVKRRITDGSILTMIGMFLKSGVMNSGNYEPTRTGSPQGGVISPLLANIYLDEFDQFMKGRGHRIVRYADDILIFKTSRSGAENALEVATNFLEKHLKLKVNQQKTHITTLKDGVKYLGVEIRPSYTTIQRKKIKAFKKKVKAQTQRNSPVNLEKIIKELNLLLRGFANYFKMANCKNLFQKLMRWIRRRLRAIQLKLWKKPRKLHRRLRQLGYDGEFDFIKMTTWRNAACQLSHWAMPNKWFSEMGLFEMDKVETGKLPPITRG